jgi:hypothetical protein
MSWVISEQLFDASVRHTDAPFATSMDLTETPSGTDRSSGHADDMVAGRLADLYGYARRWAAETDQGGAGSL